MNYITNANIYTERDIDYESYRNFTGSMNWIPVKLVQGKSKLSLAVDIDFTTFPKNTRSNTFSE